MLRMTAVLIALGVVLAIAASPAGAQATPRQGYSTPAGQVQSDVNTGNGGQSNGSQGVSRAGSSPLPFTGLDLALLVGVGLALVLVGAGLSRLTGAGSEHRRS
jgi:hypothetical protein